MSVSPDLSLYYDFAGTRSLAATFGLGPTLTFTRASSGTYFDASGVLQTASTNEPRFDNLPDGGSLGLLFELARTNELLWNRDCTDAAWTKTNITPTLDATGLGGVANSASTLTATAGNGTCGQAITLGSAEYTFSVYVKRVTGTGDIDITDNSGAAWTTLTGLSDTQWTRHDITRTQANPDVGFRIVTSGDAIEVDYGQVEANNAPSSAIATTSSSASRSEDFCSTTTLDWFNQSAGIWYVDTDNQNVDHNNFAYLFTISDGTFDNRHGIYFRHVNLNAIATIQTGAANVLTSEPVVDDWVTGDQHRFAYYYSTAGAKSCSDGTLSNFDPTVTPLPAVTTFEISKVGGVQGGINHIRQFRFYNTFDNSTGDEDKFLQDLTNGLITESLGGGNAFAFVRSTRTREDQDKRKRRRTVF